MPAAASCRRASSCRSGRTFPTNAQPTDVDESSDTYDSIDWLLKNVPNHNGRVGMVGISQPGFHVAASLMNAHPALKAASPQAPTADYYMGDDVYHNGALMLAANFGFYSSFRPRGPIPTAPKPSLPFDYGTADGYEFYLSLPPLAEVNARLFEGKAGYFQEIVDHPNYDQFWQARSIWKYCEQHRTRGAQRRRLVRRGRPDGAVVHVSQHPEEQREDRQQPGDGAVVARRLVARGRQPAGKPRLRNQDRRVLPQADPVSPGSCTT